ncbi:hypothetical protein B0A48_18852, partial [Cryoendolithus antarcticus]
LTCVKCESECKFCTVPEGTTKAQAEIWYQAAHLAREIATTCDNDVISLWLDDLHFAGISNSTQFRDIDDVLRLTSKEFINLVDAGEAFQHAVMIEEDFQDQHTLDTLQLVFKRVYTGNEIYAQPHGVQSVDKIFQDIRAGVKGINGLSFPNLAQAIGPEFTRRPQYSLLHDVCEYGKAKGQGDVAGKQVYRTVCDVESCGGFNLLGSAGAFSGAHLDALNGTWVRVLFGSKIWWVVSADRMKDNDWEDFARDGAIWNPKGKAKAIHLQEGQVLFMPPGVRIIHAVFGLLPSCLAGGQLWDSNRMPEILRNVVYIAEHQQTTNEPLAWSWGPLIGHLEDLHKAGE